MSRAGRGAQTGIDRVEFAYLTELLARPRPLFGLVRTTLGFVLLDRAGCGALRDRLSGAQPWGRADLPGRLAQRNNPPRARAEADLRRLALARARPGGLARMLARHLPHGTAWLNVGHANLSAAPFAAVRGMGGQVVVLIHDTIPLDHPEFASTGLPERFAARLRRVGAKADLVIYNSRQSRTRAERYMAQWGRVPPAIVSHLGTDVPQPDPTQIPPGLDLSRPWFVTLGTIEPRKNHTLLLDIWEEMATDPPSGGIPQLFIIGRRGWNNDQLFARLDRAPIMGRQVHELGPLPDAAAAALMQGAAALLFPSLAEGYGLPPQEAAALGVPVVCCDLAIYHEALGAYPVYADPADRYQWIAIIRALANKAETATGKEDRRGNMPRLPTWEDHFKPVLRLM